MTQDNPILPTRTTSDGKLLFDDIPSDRWIDVPGEDADEYMFSLLDGEKFTALTGLPDGLTEAFNLSVDGELIATLTGDDTYTFSGDGVESFTLNAEQLRLAFDADTADLLVMPLFAETEPETETPTAPVAVPTPSALLAGLLGLGAMAARCRRD